MAKALKTVAIVAGVAALAVVTGGAAAGLGVSLGTTLIGTSISASALLATSALASTAAGLLTKGPKVPASQTDRLTASIDPRAFRKSVFGQTAFPVDVRYEEWSGADQEYCDWIVALASHAIDGIEEIWLNTEMAWSQTTGVTAKYRGYFSIPNLILEGSPANAFSFASGRWNGSARLTGCAYARLRFKVTGNGKKAESPFVGGIPSRITIIGRGAKLYDPRRDSTVPGGSGPMRAGDQSTWRYTADDGVTIGENLPLQILRVVLGWRIRNPSTGEMKLATGSGVPARRLALASWIMAANLADEQVNRSAGGTEPRYHGAGVVSEGDEPKTALDAMCAACCARFRDTSGKLSIAIAHNDLANAATDDGLGNDDVVGGFTWDPDPSLAATPNVIRGRYVDASNNSLYQLIDYPEVRLASPDGQDRIFPLDLGVVESASQAQRIAKQVLQRKQYQREFTAPFDIRAWKYTVGDLLPFTFAPLSFNRALFRVKEQELGQGGTCNMTLTVEHAQIYAFDRDDAAPVLAAEPIVYDASRNPLVLAIADAGTTADWDGVTGAAKPADNATDSRDPNSPFGPGGTVGDALKHQTDIDTAIIAANKRTDALVQVTIPAVEKAVLDAGDRIDDARGIADQARIDIDAEIERARGVEGQLKERIDSVAAEGGYDDTAVYAEISRVDRAAISAEAAIGERIDQVQASFTSGGGNLLSNTDFTTLDGWAIIENPIGSSLVLNAAGEPWQAGGENNLSLYQAGRVGNPNLYTTVVSQPFAVSAGDFVQFYVHGASHRAMHWVTLHFYDEADNVIGYAGEYPNGTATGGRSLANWSQIGNKSFKTPPGTVRSRMWLRKYDTVAGQGDSYAWFMRPYVGIARDGQTSWNPYSPGNGKAVQIASTARIKETTDALARADVSFAEQARLIEASLGTVDNRIAASASDVTRAFADGDRALGTRATTLEAAASTVSSSAVFNDNFNFWLDGATLPSRWFLWETGGNFRTNRLAPGRGGGQFCVQTLNDVAEVNSGFVQTIYTGGAGKWVIEVTADFDSSGARGAGVTLHGIWSIDFCSDPDVNGFVGDRAGVVRSWSKMVDLDGRDQINVHAMHGWSGFGRGMAAKYMVWHRLALRPATDGEIKAGKADAALNNPGGVLAKMTGYDATLADLPNRYATAQSVQTLEAQVNFAADSGLQRTINARIEDRATVIADSKAGAVAETVRVLRGEYDGTTAEVREQRGIINGLNGKAAAYVRLVADAGNGRAALSLWSDQFGGAWQLVGNGIISGDLTVDGSITARKFNGASMAREGRSIWTGTVSPGLGQTLGVPWSLALPTIPPVGRFIYEYTFTLDTNAGQSQFLGYDDRGRARSRSFVGDGGMTVVARDAQGNPYYPRANASDRVIGTSDFAPTFNATISRGSTNYTEEDAENVITYISASYTVTKIDLKVTWVAI